MKNSLNSSRKSGPPDINKLIILHVLFYCCWSLLVSVSVSRAIWQSSVKCHIIDWYTVSFAAGGLSRTLQYAHRVRDSERSMPGLTASVHALAIEIVVLQHRGSEKPSQMCEIRFIWSCPMWPSRWGMRISINWPRLKSCKADCDEWTRWEICSSQSQDGGCFDIWGWRGLHVTKIWGFHVWWRFVLFLFATTMMFILPQHSCNKGSLLYLHFL